MPNIADVPPFLRDQIARDPSLQALLSRSPEPNLHHSQQQPPETTSEPSVPLKHSKITPKERDFQVGGTEKTILLDGEIKQNIINRIMDRVEVLKLIEHEASEQNKPAAISEMDRLLLNPEVQKRLASGEINREDLALFWFAINDEFLIKTMASGRLLSERYALPPKKRRRFPFLSRASEQSREIFEPIDTQISTAYLDRIRYREWGIDAMESDLLELYKLRQTVETTLFGSSELSLYPEEFESPMNPISLQTGNKNKIINEVLHQREIILRDRNTTFAQLWQENRVEAVKVMHEANEKALQSFGHELFQTIISNPPEVRKESIIEASNKLKQPSPEVTAATQKIENAQQEVNIAQSRVEALEQELEEARTSYNDSRLAKSEAQKRAKDAKANLDRIEQRINYYEAEMRNLSNLNTQGLITTDELIRRQEQYRQMIDNEQNRLVAEREKVNEAASQLAHAKAEFSLREALLKKIETRLIHGIQGTPGELTQAKDILAQKITALEAAQKELEAIRTEALGNEDKSQALEIWSRLLDNEDGTSNFSRIIGTLLQQKPGEPYSPDNLRRRGLNSQGKLSGTETIRESIFKTLMTNNYTPQVAEIARKMLSDEAIGRAILIHLHADPSIIPIAFNVPIPNPTRTLNDVFTFINIKRQEIASLKPSDPNYVSEKSAREKEILQAGSTIADIALSGLKSKSRTEIVGIISFLLSEGLKSAQNGIPYLDLANYSFVPEVPAFKVEEETTLAYGMGHAEVEKQKIVWDGDVRNTLIPHPLSTALHPLDPLELHHRISEEFSDGQVTYVVEVETNERFFESLPDSAAPGTPGAALPDVIKQTFYDRSGKLNIDKLELSRIKRAISNRSLHELRKRASIPQWVEIRRSTKPNVAQTLAELNTMNAGLGEKISVATANSLLAMKPKDRLPLLKGIRVPIEINGVPLTGTSAKNSYSIDFDNNGNFYITNKASTARMELEQFFEIRTKAYMANLGVTELHPTQRQQLQREFALIQAAIGKSIQEAQTRY